MAMNGKGVGRNLGHTLDKPTEARERQGSAQEQTKVTVAQPRSR